MGYDVTALDFAENMIEAVRRNSDIWGIPVTAVRGDAEDLPFADGSFDAIVSNYALWAIPHPEKAMSEWMRVLAPSGIVAYVDSGKNNRDSLVSRIWRKQAFRMRAKDGNAHAIEPDPDEQKSLESLWSRDADRPAEDLRMMKAAGFSDVMAIRDVQKKVFKGKRYIEYGYLKNTFLISGVKRERMPPLIPC